ncbi:MAG TPA: FHA domain-containing protein [Anaeromyxobacteraceae bacterium]|jgi:hypothetical protein|nr:FHA domain-containing protein [Anaeromyxobacteraceae bacterium]
MRQPRPADPSPEATRALAGRLLRGGPLPREVPHLQILTGPGAGATAPLADGVTLGRGKEASCRVDDPAVSRLHARVERQGAGEVLVDLGSKNGLRLNDRRLRRPRRLRDGDRIALGETELLVVAPAPSPAARRAGPGPGAPHLSRHGGARLLLSAAALLALAAALWMAG